MKPRLSLGVALLGLSLALPSHAGIFDDSEARAQLDQIRRDYGSRLDRLEGSSAGQLTLSNQIEELRSEVARLRGQVEELTYSVQTLEKRQKDFYLDLDGRLRKLEGTGGGNAATPAAPAAAISGAAAAGTTGGAAPAPAAAGNEQHDYEVALGQLKGGQVAEAQKGFEAFIRKYPNSSSLPNATFWAGNAALQAKEVAAANRHFAAVVNRWPDDARAPDAMLGLANSQQTLGDVKGARTTLENLVVRYPGSPAAQSAKQRLGK